MTANSFDNKTPIEESKVNDERFLKPMNSTSKLLGLSDF
jgi:hypothetical protein